MTMAFSNFTKQGSIPQGNTAFGAVYTRVRVSSRLMMRPQEERLIALVSESALGRHQIGCKQQENCRVRVGSIELSATIMPRLQYRCAACAA
jgi:hypothetical protein